MKKIIMIIMILISCNLVAEELSHDIMSTPLIKVNKKIVNTIVFAYT